MTRKDLHNRRLKFQGSNRPKKGYLYFMYLMALHQFENEGRFDASYAELDRSRKIFAPLTPSMRRSMVPAFAPQLGPDLAPLSKEEKADAENELKNSNPERLVADFQTGVFEMDNDGE